nr:MAG TPA: hypothetical protein [Caudoviricetes sp.]
MMGAVAYCTKRTRQGLDVEMHWGPVLFIPLFFQYK